MTQARARLVVDASVILKWQLEDEDHVAEAVALRNACLIDQVVQLSAPKLILYELANGLWSAVRRSRVSPDASREALGLLLAAQIELHEPDTRHILDMALKHSVTAYDAAYLSLAERLGIDLWTGDRRLYDAVATDLPKVRWIGDYVYQP